MEERKMSATTLTADERRRLEDAGLTPVNETTDKHGEWAVEVKPSPVAYHL